MHRILLLAFLIVPVLTACAKRPSIIPNSDPALRKTSNQFSSDAANRHPFKADAPVAGPLDGRASVDYGLKTINLVNLSKDDWVNLEVWVNKKYVVYVPRIEPGTLRALNFQMFFDGRGNSLPTKSDRPIVETVHIYTHQTMYSVRVVLAE